LTGAMCLVMESSSAEVLENFLPIGKIVFVLWSGAIALD
jgi:predicted thioesterase